MIYQTSITTIINKLARVTFKSLIFKSDISDHFHVSLFLPLRNPSTEKELTYIFKRTIKNNFIEMFRHKVYETDWAKIETCVNLTERYKMFTNALPYIIVEGRKGERGGGGGGGQKGDYTFGQISPPISLKIVLLEKDPILRI